MSDLTGRMKQFAHERGADLIGVAPAERFEDLPAEESPLSIFPEMTAAVVIGRRITRGTLRGLEEGTNLNTYEMFGYSWLDKQFVSLSTFEVCEFLEDEGWEAVPLFPFPQEAYPQGIPVREGAPAPNVYPDFQYAAVAAGLGEMSYLRVTLTPEFGHRQRFQMLLTDAPLEADPMLEAGLCGLCYRCVEVCPLGAISAEPVETMVIGGREFPVAQIDYSICRRCQNGARPNIYHSAGAPDRLGAICFRTCLQAIEDAGKLETQFQHRFRVREPWAVDVAGQRIDPAHIGQSAGRGCADPEGFAAADEEGSS